MPSATNTEYANETGLKDKEVYCSIKGKPNRGWALELINWEVQQCHQRPRFCWFFSSSIYSIGFIPRLTLLCCGLAVFDNQDYILLHFYPALFTYLIQVLGHMPIPEQIIIRGHEISLRPKSSPLKARGLVFPEGYTLFRGGVKQNCGSIRNKDEMSASRQSILFIPLLINY